MRRKGAYFCRQKNLHLQQRWAKVEFLSPLTLSDLSQPKVASRAQIDDCSPPITLFPGNPALFVKPFVILFELFGVARIQEVLRASFIQDLRSTPLWNRSSEAAISLSASRPYKPFGSRAIPKVISSAHAMYRCQLCQSVVPAKTPCHRLVLQWRKKEYPFRPRANVLVRKPSPDKKPKEEYRDDPGGQGYEIVKEIIVCTACAASQSRT